MELLLFVHIMAFQFSFQGQIVSSFAENYDFGEEIGEFYVSFARIGACQSVAIHYEDSRYKSLLFNVRKRHPEIPTSFVNYTHAHRFLKTLNPSLQLVLGNSKKMLSQAFVNGENDTFDANDFWLIQVPDVSDTRAIQRLFTNVNLQYNSLTFVWSSSKTNQGQFDMKEVYKLNDYTPNIEILDYGFWNPPNGLVVNELIIWERRANMKGQRFRVAANFNPPYITKVIKNCTDEQCFQGMFAEVWHALAYTMNFTFLLNPPPDRAWGIKLPDGKWNGMIGQLHRREIDIAPAEFTVTALRSEVVDFNLPITESHQKLFVKNPAESFNWTAFIEPLSWSCWGVIVLFIIFVPLAMAPAIRLGNEPEQDEFTLSKSFCFVAGAMTIARGWSTTPWRIQNRILFFSVMLGGTLIYWHWEAMIISFLAVRTTVLPFSSMEEMLTKTDFKVAVQPGTSYVDTFRYSNNPMLKRIWTERIEPYIADYPQSKMGLSMKIIDESGYALFDNFFTTISYEPYEKCQIIAVPVAYFPVQFAYAFQKKSPYFDAFWYQLNKMKERGATKQILEKYEAGNQVCPDYSGKPLGFGQCFTAFIALMGGMVLGLLCLGVEWVLLRNLGAMNNRTPESSEWTKKPRSIFDNKWGTRASSQEQYHENELRRHQKALEQIRAQHKTVYY